MSLRRKKSLILAGGLLTALIIAAAVWGWLVLRVDDVPDQLATIERPAGPIVIPSAGETPDLRVADLQGQTSVIILEGIQSMRNEQGKPVNQALNRWILPESVKVYIVWDAQGMRLFEERVSRFAGFFAEEVRFPLFIDWDGALIEGFKLVKGHHGLLVLGPDQTIMLRHSGGLQGSQIEELRALLGAKEPPPPPPAPPFEIAGLTLSSCQGRGCVVAILGQSVERGDIPWIDDGFEGTRTECFERMHRPEIRLAAAAMRVELDHAHGLVVGQVRGLDLKGWRVVEDTEAAEAAREAFGVAADTSALVVIDAEGTLVFQGTGFIPMYQWTLAVDAIGETILREDQD